VHADSRTVLGADSRAGFRPGGDRRSRSLGACLNTQTGSQFTRTRCAESRTIRSSLAHRRFR
jgi:hypothetical protein